MGAAQHTGPPLQPQGCSAPLRGSKPRARPKGLLPGQRAPPLSRRNGAARQGAESPGTRRAGLSLSRPPQWSRSPGSGITAPDVDHADQARLAAMEPLARERSHPARPRPARRARRGRNGAARQGAESPSSGGHDPRLLTYRNGAARQGAESHRPPVERAGVRGVPQWSCSPGSGITDREGLDVGHDAGPQWSPSPGSGITGSPAAGWPGRSDAAMEPLARERNH
jgi:hypothetical protein